MKNNDYVNFECTHVNGTDYDDPDEREMLAYADIDGFPENGEHGSVICRVWLMPGRNGTDRKYAVDWHYNTYRSNVSVRELIDQAKADLRTYFENEMLVSVFKKAYGKYQLDWMMAYGFSLALLVEKLDHEVDDTGCSVSDAYDHIINGDGFGGMIWPSEDYFRNNEWKDEVLMASLLDGRDYVIWHER